VIGDDEAGQTLLTQLSKANIESHTYSDPSLVTTVKVRVIARQQQLLRVDFEDAPNKEVLSEQLDRYGELVSKYDLVILSDYGKGGLAHIARMIEFARAADRPVLVDPKGDDYSRYAGATIVTPNRAELRAVVGKWTSEADLERRAQSLRKDLGLSALLLTRSEEGMTLYSEKGVLSVPAHTREVFDVSGAGDTVIAVLAAMLAAGSTLQEAVITANRAGGIVVGKLGTSTVTTAELFGGPA
jgi:rfaE bifunctional protein kinase chain/domain